MPVAIGHRVKVQFNRTWTPGYVIRLHRRPPPVPAKPIAALLDPEPVLLPQHVRLAQRVAERYWAPLLQTLVAMLPPRVRHGPTVRQSQVETAFLAPRPPPGQALAGSDELGSPPAEILAALTSAEPRRVDLTGSGKRRLAAYATAARATLARDRQVLVLVPEVAATERLAEDLARRVGARVALLNGAMPAAARARQWWRIRRGLVNVVVGSRSAVFAPLERLGLLIIDDESAPAFRSERAPRYDTGWVAEELARITGSVLLAGGPAPRLARRQAFGRARARLDLDSGQPRPAIRVVDMRMEGSGRKGALSRQALVAIDAALTSPAAAGGGGILLHLNRRGVAAALLCPSCGERSLCPRCQTPAGVFQAPGEDGVEPEGHLACRTCGWAGPRPLTCSGCGASGLRRVGLGTQRLEQLVRRLWPDRRVARIDADAAADPASLQAIVDAYRSGAIEILIGTRLVSRLGPGRWLEAGLAVAVDADLPLGFPDFRAGEDCYCGLVELSHQVRPQGTLVLQTWNPDHPAVQAAAQGRPETFLAAELAARQSFGFPPFADMVVLRFTHEDLAVAAESASALARDLAAAAAGLGRQVRVIGPSPGFPERVRGRHVWEIVLAGQRLDRLRDLVPRARGWSVEMDP